MRIHLSLYLSISLSLCIHIHIYIYTHTYRICEALRSRSPRGTAPGAPPSRRASRSAGRRRRRCPPRGRRLLVLACLSLCVMSFCLCQFVLMCVLYCMFIIVSYHCLDVGCFFVVYVCFLVLSVFVARLEDDDEARVGHRLQAVGDDLLLLQQQLLLLLIIIKPIIIITIL